MCCNFCFLRFVYISLPRFLILFCQLLFFFYLRRVAFFFFFFFVRKPVVCVWEIRYCVCVILLFCDRESNMFFTVLECENESAACSCRSEVPTISEYNKSTLLLVKWRFSIEQVDTWRTLTLLLNFKKMQATEREVCSVLHLQTPFIVRLVFVISEIHWCKECSNFILCVW